MKTIYKKPKGGKKLSDKSKLYVKLVEMELNHYHQTLEEFEQMRNEIADLSGRSDGSFSQGVANPTQIKSFQLMSSIVLKEMERRIRAIDYVIQVLKASPEVRKIAFLEMKYLRHDYSDQKIQETLCIEQATFYRWRTEIIELTAERLGLQL